MLGLSQSGWGGRMQNSKKFIFINFDWMSMLDESGGVDNDMLCNVAEASFEQVRKSFLWILTFFFFFLISARECLSFF